MAYQPVAATALIELVYTYAGQTCENTLYVRHDATEWSESELSAQAAYFESWFGAELAPFMSSTVALVRIDVTDLSDQFGLKLQHVVDPQINGEVAGQALPNNCSFTTTFATAKRGRSFRGRNYLVGLSESNVELNEVDSTTRAGILAAYTALIGPGVLPGGAQWVVVSRVVNGVVQMPTALTTFVNSVYHYDNTVDSQRRRLPGRGR